MYLMPPMRPKAREPRLERLNFRAYLAQPKINGWHVVVFRGRVTTRTGRDLTAWPCFRGMNLDAPVPIVAELVSDRGPGPANVARLRSGQGEVILWAFDVQVGGGLEERLALLPRVIPPGVGWGIVETWPLASKADANRLCRQYWADGHEGLVLKLRGSAYLPGDRPEWIRMKRQCG